MEFSSHKEFLELTSLVYKEQSYKIVQKNAMKAWKENSSFYNKIISDRKITNKIPVNKIKSYLILVIIQKLI